MLIHDMWHSESHSAPKCQFKKKKLIIACMAPAMPVTCQARYYVLRYFRQDIMFYRHRDEQGWCECLHKNAVLKRDCACMAHKGQVPGSLVRINP